MKQLIPDQPKALLTDAECLMILQSDRLKDRSDFIVSWLLGVAQDRPEVARHLGNAVRFLLT